LHRRLAVTPNAIITALALVSHPPAILNPPGEPFFLMHALTVS